MSCNDPCADGILINIDSAAQGPAGPPGPVADVINYEFVLMAGDTIISGTDNSAKEFSYNPQSLQVFINGVLLSETDYTATDGTSIILNEAAANNNDLAQITTQIPPEGYDPTNDFNRLQGQIDDNRTDIDGLRQDVDQNTQDIAELQDQAGAQAVTTADVMTVGALPFADPDEDPKTQQEANWILHDWIKESEKEIADARAEFQDLDKDVTDLTGKVSGLSDDVDGLTIAVATNTVNISKNASDIGQLQTDVGNITVPDLGPLDARVTTLEATTADHDGKITDLRTDVDALGAPVDLGPLNDAISDNTVAIEQNTKDILGLKATDAKHTGEIADLQVSVGNLEAIDHDTSGFAEIAKDNQFTVSQTIKDGVKLTGSQAFIECDTGTPLSVRNNNFSNPVINVMRSNGDVAISLEASGHIRGLATDASDPTSAVNVEFVQDLVGDADHTHDQYATQIQLKTEEQARILADQQLDAKIDAIKPYDDSGIKKSLADEEAARIAGDAALNDKINSLELGDSLPDDLVNEDRLAEALEPYATKEYVTNAIDDIEIPSIDGLATEEFVTEGDEATLEAAKNFTEGEMIGVATEDFVSAYVNSAGEVITESYTQAIADQAEVQAAKDAEQDAEMNMIEGRLAAVESVTIDGVWELDLQLAVPRPGEFVLLKGQAEVASRFDEVTMLIFNEESKMGVIDFSAVTVGDVFRIATAQDEEAAAGRLSESLAEFKVTDVLATASYGVTLIRSNGDPQDGVDYGARLLSSFDPDGLATLDGTVALVEKAEENANKYTDAQIAAADYLPTTGGTVTGKVSFRNGAYIDANANSCMDGRSSFNIRVHADRPATFESGSSYKAVLQVLKYEDQDGENSDRALSPFVLYANGNIDTRNITATGQVKVTDAEFKVERNSENVFRVQETSIIAKLPVTSHERITANDGIMLGGGNNQQNIVAKKGYAGNLIYEETGDVETDMRFAWGNHKCWFYKEVDMQQNKIIGCGNADMSRGKDVVNVNTLNAALADLEVGVDTEELDERYVSKDGDEINSYLKVHSTSSGTTSVPFGVYTRGNFSTPKFHVTGAGSVRAGTNSSEAFMAYYDYDLVTLKKLKEELEEFRSVCMPLLWKYNPNALANELGNGEFNLCTTPSWDGTADCYLYMSRNNARGKKWFGKNSDDAYSHDLGWHGMVTIYDYDPDLVFQAKAGKLHFNEGSNNYFKMHISYLKKNFSLSENRYYNINLPGFLPQYRYTNAMYTDGNTFSAFDAPDENKVEE